MMSSSLQNPAAAMRPCVFCGKSIGMYVNRCPFCRETIPQVRLSSRVSTSGREQMRRGVLYMLLGGVIYFFSAGYSGMTLPFVVPPLVTAYLAPVVLLAGAGLFLYGIYLRLRS